MVMKLYRQVGGPKADAIALFLSLLLADVSAC